MGRAKFGVPGAVMSAPSPSEGAGGDERKEARHTAVDTVRRGSVQAAGLYAKMRRANVGEPTTLLERAASMGVLMDAVPTRAHLEAQHAYAVVQMHMACFALASVLSIAIAVWNNEELYGRNPAPATYVSDAADFDLSWSEFQHTKHTSTNEALKAVILLLTLLSIVNLFQVYRREGLIRRYRPKAPFWQTKLLWEFLREALPLFFIPIPGVNVDVRAQVHSGTEIYNLDSLLTMFMFVRIVYGLRVAFVFSPFYDPSNRHLGKLAHVKVDSVVAAKWLVNEFPIAVITTLTVIFTVCNAYIVRVAEWPTLDVGADERDFKVHLWLMIITCTTVGYGDFYPSTFLGRVGVVICTVWGLLLLGMLVTVTGVQVNLSVDERRLLMFLERKALKRERLNTLVFTIQKAYKRGRDTGSHLHGWKGLRLSMRPKRGSREHWDRKFIRAWEHRVRLQDRELVTSFDVKASVERMEHLMVTGQKKLGDALEGLDVRLTELESRGGEPPVPAGEGGSGGEPATPTPAS